MKVQLQHRQSPSDAPLPPEPRPTPAYCKRCGLQIYWARRDNRWHPPLELVHAEFYVTTLVGEEVVIDEAPPIYRMHWCATSARREVRRLQENALSAAYAHELADVEDCPKCGVLAGQPCENLAMRARGQTGFTVWPHTERMEAAAHPEAGQR